jgi:hypothetical protein
MYKGRILIRYIRISSPNFFVFYAFFAAILLFGCGTAAAAQNCFRPISRNNFSHFSAAASYCAVDMPASGYQSL